MDLLKPPIPSQSRKLRHRGPKSTPVDPNQILDAAEEIFSQKGLQAASLRSIAQRVGCDPALIYYHFDSKEAMFLALLDRCLPPLAGDLERLGLPSHDAPTSLRIWEVLQIYRRHLGQHVGLREVVRGQMIRGAEGLQEKLAERIRATSGKVWNILRQGIEKGELRSDLPVELVAFFLIKLYLEILDIIPTMAPRVAGIPVDQALSSAERAWFELYWRGIAADPLAPLPPLPSTFPEASQNNAHA